MIKDSTDSYDWLRLSYCALFVGKPLEAIQASQKTLELNPQAERVETSLAFGYLLNDQWPDAEAIFQKWKGKQFADSSLSCEDVFISVVDDLEAAGITHPDFEKVRNLFSK
ncbi:MAG: hypothetical protein IPM36_01460 [Lewinellaceae bacterium]|nr:hypothetical protein [Lewinellaceae bacterium]